MVANRARTLWLLFFVVVESACSATRLTSGNRPGEELKSNSAGPIAIVFKTKTRYDAFVQGKFDRLLKTRSLEFPIGVLSTEEIVREIGESGFSVNYVAIADLQERVEMVQTASRTGGKQGRWSARVTGEIGFYDVQARNALVRVPVKIEVQYDDSGSVIGNAVRSMAEKGLGDIYYYEQTPDQRILYWLGDRVKEELGRIVLDGMATEGERFNGPGKSIHSASNAVLDTTKTLFENSLELLSTQLGHAMESTSAKTVAVTEFAWIDGSHHDLEAYISEELTTRLANNKIVSVVERSLRDRAVQELKLNLSDLIDPKHAQQFGKMTGADTILAGSLTDLGYKYKVNCRLIDTKDGTVRGAVAGSIYHDERLEGLMTEQ